MPIEKNMMEYAAKWVKLPLNTMIKEIYLPNCTDLDYKYPMDCVFNAIVKRFEYLYNNTN